MQQLLHIYPCIYVCLSTRKWNYSCEAYFSQSNAFYVHDIITFVNTRAIWTPSLKSVRLRDISLLSMAPPESKSLETMVPSLETLLFEPFSAIPWGRDHQKSTLINYTARTHTIQPSSIFSPQIKPHFDVHEQVQHKPPIPHSCNIHPLSFTPMLHHCLGLITHSSYNPALKATYLFESEHRGTSKSLSSSKTFRRGRFLNRSNSAIEAATFGLHPHLLSLRLPALLPLSPRPAQLPMRNAALAPILGRPRHLLPAQRSKLSDRLFSYM